MLKDRRKAQHRHYDPFRCSHIPSLIYVNNAVLLEKTSPTRLMRRASTSSRQAVWLTCTHYDLIQPFSFLCSKAFGYLLYKHSSPLSKGLVVWNDDTSLASARNARKPVTDVANLLAKFVRHQSVREILPYRGGHEDMARLDVEVGKLKCKPADGATVVRWSEREFPSAKFPKGRDVIVLGKSAYIVHCSRFCLSGTGFCSCFCPSYRKFPLMQNS